VVAVSLKNLAKAGKMGAKLWVKEGHLNDVNNQIARVHQA